MKNTKEYELPMQPSIFQDERWKRKKVPINLRFFANDDKTEDATDKKKKQSREEGQVAMSPEIGTAFLFLSVFSALKAMSSYIYEKSIAIFHYNYKLTDEIDDMFDLPFLSKYVVYMFTQILIIVIPIFAVVMVVGVISNLIQVGWAPTTKPLTPKFSKLDPMKGMKKLFSMNAIVELIKSLGKMAVIFYSLNSVIMKEISGIYKIIDMDLFEAAGYIGNIVVDMGMNVGGAFLFIAAIDFAYQKIKHKKDIRMTKQEIKEEFKQADGNPQIKSAIKQKMREASMRRMMQDVQTADVIITNPTHFAIALRYDREKDDAPRVIAKGMDHLALRIKEKAKENRIEIVENKPLARALYKTCEVGKFIPPELYQAVAEILAFVYRLKNVV